MRLNDLLETPVFDERGTSLGHVQDVRLIQDGPVIGTFGAALAVEGLIVGTRRFGERLGFHRTTMHGPPLIKGFFEWLHSGARLVPWERVVSIAGDRITISGSAGDLEPPDKLDQ